MKTNFKFIIILTLLVFGSVFAQQKKISGIVSSNGELIPGVTILVKDKTTGTTTDFDGAFSILAEPTDVLIFSSIGFKKQEIPIGAQTDLNVELTVESEELEEVVLVGYGTVKKKDVTSAISTVKGEELSKRVTTNIQDALAGQLPGVQVQSNGGQPGSVSTVTVRGISTLNDNTPLYVVDDVPLEDINFLSASDIESVQVLKDASAAAIFGSRASNGVIIIKTKQAKTDRISINLNAYSGLQTVAQEPHLAGAEEYANIINTARTNDGNSPIYPNPEELGKGTDWWDQTTQTAPISDVNLNITTGTNTMKISTGLSYQDQDGIVKGSSFTRWTARLNTEFKLGEKITIGENFTYAKSNTVNGPNLVWDVHRLEPVTDPYLPDYEQVGRNEFSIYSPTITDVPNAIGLLARTFDETDYYRTVANLYLNWEILKGLSLKTQYSIYSSGYENNWFTPDYYIEETDRQDVNSVGRTHNNRTNSTWNNTLTYENIFENHSLNLMAGMIFEDQEHRTLYGTGENIPSNHPDLRYLEAATEAFFTAGNNENYSMLSYIGRLNYGFMDKYLLTATIRADGSSLFPEENKWGYFPSVSVAWVISNEDFLKDSEWVNLLKFRAGWGQIGNDNRNSIPVDARLTTIGNEYYTSGYGQNTIIGTAPDNVGNPDIKWETVEDINLGLDLTLFDYKLGINFDVFKRTTSDMLMAKTIPAYLGSGYNAQWSNVGSFNTQGFDLGLNYKESFTDFTMDFTVNISKYTAKVEKLADGEAIWDGNHQRLDFLSYTAEGETPGSFYGYVSDGIFQNRTEINSHSDEFGNIIQPFAQPGDMRFKDLDGDGELTDKDRTIIGNPVPDFNYGITLKFGYQNFDLSTLFTGSYGNDMLNAANPYLMSGSGNYNSYAGLFDSAWDGEGSTNTQPRLSNEDPNQNFRYSDYYIEDGSFFRLKNMQLGYTIAESISKKGGINQIRFYLSGENIFTVTDFSGLDPDIGGYATLQGVDWGHYPLPRIYNIGINMFF
jgi:TonB-linked SusC/RagA family outer membrane protein